MLILLERIAGSPKFVEFSTEAPEKETFKNCIVTGIVLAEDGKKMSKKLKNYPDPTEVINKYGADAMRFYMLSSPAVQAESLSFSENEKLSACTTGELNI